jgi:hypothetical protein
MNKHEHNEDNVETIRYVYIPDEEINGFLIKEGPYYSIIEYTDKGVCYHVEIANEDFIVTNEINIGYDEETEENL